MGLGIWVTHPRIHLRLYGLSPAYERLGDVEVVRQEVEGRVCPANLLLGTDLEVASVIHLRLSSSLPGLCSLEAVFIDRGFSVGNVCEAPVVAIRLLYIEQCGPRE